ncbi:MAG TPA: N-acetylmuramoyl-L-alanine amidase [Candidatus Limnocylindrales bacterium]|nr:N-acetylmuramoyl-L-alanine amidase [Candidatus Limnocylindrales bacterium]
MTPSRRAHPFAALLVASIALALGGLLAMPALPRIVAGPVAVQAAQIPVQLARTTDVTLPFPASDVSLHWHGSPQASVTVQFATDPGAFGDPVPVGADEDGLGGAGRDGDPTPDPATAESYGPVLWAGDARYLRVTSDLPIAQLTVVAYKTDGPPRMVLATDGSADSGSGGSVANAAVNAPAIITRAQWGADESLRFDYAGHETWPPSYYPLQVFIVHHTAGRNNDPNPEATIRAIYYDDTIIRGWGDLGYNFLIDAQGHVYEGRHARNYASGELHDEEDLAGNVARGAHAKGYNSGSLGIAVLGTFDTVLPTTAARNALEQLIAWDAARHGIDPTTSSLYTNPDTGTSKVLNHISGHRDVNATDCPGAAFYPTFPSLRQDVASKIAAATGPSVDHTPPTVQDFVSLAPDPTGGSSIDFGLRFSEPVTGLTTNDFAVGGTSSGWAVTAIAGIGAGYTITVTWTAPPATPTGLRAPTGPPDGTVELDLAANAVTDGGNNTGPADPAAATATFATDTTPPTVGLTYTPRGSATTATSIDVAVTFSEPVKVITAADIQVGGTSNAATPWTVDPVVGSGTSYGFTIQALNPADGTLTIAIAAGVTTDAAGNQNVASAVHTVIIDRTAPKTSAPTVSLRSGIAFATALPIVLTWSGSDGAVGSGIASYDVARSIDGGAFIVIRSGLTSPTYGTSVAPGHAYRYEVRAHDRAGNVSPWVPGATVRPTLLQQTSTSLRWSGVWVSTISSVWSGGSDRYSSATGASVSLTTSARAFAFVTARGPGRGQARIYVDGVLRATVDLSATTVQYRFVAWATGWSSVATHTIRIVVVGTAGHPRVDVDALEILR